MNLLVIGPELPKPDRQGGDARLVGLLGLLARKHHIYFYSIFDPETGGEAEPYARILRDAGISILPAAWDYGLERALFERVYDAVLFEFWLTADPRIELVRRHQPWAPIIIDSVDIQFRREELGLALGLYDPAAVEADKRRELSAYREADAVVCISDEETRLLESLGGIARCVTISHLVPERPRSSGPRAPELLFLGGFRHRPNADGLFWFVREIWPTIRAEVPAARLTVVGSQPTEDVLNLSRVDGIEVVGYVLDLATNLDRAALMVVPLRYGAGVKTKLAEAFAAGMAVVSTSVGAQGLDVRSGEHLLIADEPAEFARHVVELLGDPARAERMGRAGREYIASLCSPAAIDAALDSLLATLVPRRRPLIPPRAWLARWANLQAEKARTHLGTKKRKLSKFFSPHA